MLGNNKRRVKFNFSLSSSGSQRFGIKFYFWRLLQQGANGGREGKRQVTYTSTACKRLGNPQKHTHELTCIHTDTDTSICGSHEKFNFLTLLVHTCKGRRREPPAQDANPNPNSNPNAKTNPNRTRSQLWKTKQSRQPPLPSWLRVGVFVSVCLSGSHTREFNVCVILKQCENCAYAQCCDSSAAPTSPLS